MWGRTRASGANRTGSLAAAAALCGAAAVALVASFSRGPGPAAALLEVVPAAGGELAVAAGGRQSLLARALRTAAPPERFLTDAPDVAEWIYNNENGDQDGTFGPDGGWVPWQEEPCPTGICHNFYTARRRAPSSSRGVASPLAGAPRWVRAARDGSGAGAREASRSLRGRGARLRGAGGRGRGARLTALGEVSDFPDMDEYLPTKEDAAQVNDIYDAFQPAEEQVRREGLIDVSSPWSVGCLLGLVDEFIFQVMSLFSK